jgi:hypothetical protein
MEMVGYGGETEPHLLGSLGETHQVLRAVLLTAEV